jgi:chromate transporter
MYIPIEMPVAPPSNLAELFTGFLAIGARSFGGVMPWAHRTMVEERRWLTQEDFAETVGLCQFLPGPNIGNASIVLGKRWFGLKGSVVAFLGLMALPFVWVMALGVLYMDFSSIKEVRNFVTGVGLAGAGLILATAIKLGRALTRRAGPFVLAAGVFLAVALARWPLYFVLAAGLVVGVVAARRKLL